MAPDAKRKHQVAEVTKFLMSLPDYPGYPPSDKTILRRGIMAQTPQAA
jgi:hypothetical protein